ncbi:MAG: DUF3619 family protein [Burkholderiales bacterium]|jgi:hypothetical protein|nr:DUF3619 family protein [Burkholderiales bacterium]
MNAHEHETAQKIARVLDQSTRNMGGDTVAKLAAARGQALAGYQVAPGWKLAWAGAWTSQSSERPGLRYALPIALLLMGLISIGYWHSGIWQNNELADLDVRLLTDDLPIDAYLDKGFDSWLNRQSR